MEGVPPGVDLSKELLATDIVPVGLGVLGRGLCLAGRLATNRPSRLGDPDRLASDGTLSLTESRVEERATLANVIDHGVLEVRISINSNPVYSI